MTDRIYVTQPYLPPLEEFVPYLQEIWRSKILTNGGAFHRLLEAALCEYLGVEHLALFANGTTALMTAFRTERLAGEVITTPFSFVATAHSLLWSGLEPVFVDIDPDTLNLDPTKIEAAITPRTTAIMPVHVYGRPCDVAAIQKIAHTHSLKVIYDAAHAFGVKWKRSSVLNHGDLSVLSFHSTKVFNTFEGGAIFCPNVETKQRIDRLKNFGFIDEVTVDSVGINGKMSEINAAYGLLLLKHIDHALARRGEIAAVYRAKLDGVKGIRCLSDMEDTVPNHSFFPVLVQPEYPLSRDQLYQTLKDRGIYARRYFYPLISDFPMYRAIPSARRENLSVAADVAAKVLCLPIYPALEAQDQHRVIDVIRGNA